MDDGNADARWRQFCRATPGFFGDPKIPPEWSRRRALPNASHGSNFGRD